MSNLNNQGYWEVRTRDENQRIECWDFDSLGKACNFSMTLEPADQGTLHWVVGNHSFFIDFLWDM